MDDLLRLYPFCEAQCQIVVLCALKTRPEPAQIAHKVGAVDAQMRDEIMRAEKSKIPIRLEVRPVMRTLLIDFVFVGGNEFRIRPLEQTTPQSN